MKRSWIVALVCIAVVLVGGAPAPARSASPNPQTGLKMEAEAAFDGYFKYGEWLPVWVQLENSGPDLDAEARVRVPGSWGTISFVAPVSLPGGSRKRIPLYVLPNNFSHTLELELTAGGQVLLSQKVAVNPLANISYLVGMLAPQRGALSFIAGVSLPGQERPITLVDLALSELPERPEGLRSFDTLILNDTDTSSLTPQQQVALVSWVRQGGRLVIGGGPGAQQVAAGLPDVLLPFVPHGEVELATLAGLANFAQAEAIRVPGPFVVATGEQSPGHTLAEQNAWPLVRERVVGRGSVYFVALDLAISPFDAWTGTAAFWERLLAPGAAYPDWLPRDVSIRQMQAGPMTYALSRLPTLDLPSIRGLSLLLVLYILLVGPVNYLALRWRNRLHWAWVSVPLITLAFSGGAFGLGFALRGTDLILNKIAVIELQPDGSADVTSYLGLFSPARQSYAIEVGGGTLLSPLTPDYNPWGPVAANTGGEIAFVQGEPGYVRGLAVNQWSMQTFMTEGLWANLGRIEGELQVEGETLVGTVRNQTGYTLTDTALILGNRFVHLGDLSPGQAAPVTMELIELQSQNMGQPLSYALFQDQLVQSGPGGPPREAELKRAVLQSVFEQGAGFEFTSSVVAFGGSDRPRRGLLLIGWLNQAPPEVRVAGRTPSQQTTALLYASLAYDLPRTGDISLPPGLIPGKLVQMPAEGGMCGSSTTAIWLGRGEAIFEFQVPDEARDVRVQSLTLAIGSDGGGWWQPPEVAVYAWDEERWLAVNEPIIGINLISDADGLMSSDGLVRIRLGADANQGGCLYPELGLEGER
jgi:hypothetical protein